MKRFHHAAASWAPVLLWMGVIFWFSAQPSLPGLPDPTADHFLKKGGHAVGYAILAVLTARAARSGRPLSLRHAVLATLIAAAYAVTDEFHQSLVPGRTPSAYDWSVDIGGAVIGLVAYARPGGLIPPGLGSRHTGDLQ